MFRFSIALVLSTSVVAFAGAKQSALAERSEIVFKEKSPHSDIDEVLARTDIEFFDASSVRTIRREFLEEQYHRAKSNWNYILTEEPFQVIVPSGYRADEPHGLLVWMGSATEMP